MNLYKFFFPNKNFRVKVLQALSFLPDKFVVRVQYFLKTGRLLNLKYPNRFTEKIQWYKLFYKDPDLKRCSDKYAVREYVMERGCGNILNELYGVWSDVGLIDFSGLPSSFILKATHGSGTNLIVEDKDKDKDKAKVDLENLRPIFKGWLKYNTSAIGREWGYKGIKPKIIAEKVLPRDSRGDLPDFKFFCFDGRVYCLYVMVDYVDDHVEGKLAFYDREFRPLNVFRKDFKPFKEVMEKPKNFDEMLRVAERLSEGFPHVRVDLYNIEGAIVFGEMTFYNASGYTVFDPDSFDYELGEHFDLKRVGL